MNHQLAGIGVIEIQIRLASEQFVHQIATEKRQRKQPARRLFALAMRTGTDESHQPAPLLEIDARTKVNRRIPSQKPFRQLREHARASQRSDIAIGKLASVGKTGLARNIVVALDDRDLMPVGPQIPGRG